MGTAPRIIIDTDLGCWWDDATALGVANVLASRGEVELLAVTSCIGVESSPAAIHALNSFYGHPQIPVGICTDGPIPTGDPRVANALAERLDVASRSQSRFAESAALIAQVLRKSPDRSVTIIGIGGYTNLAHLLTRERDLIETKVTRLVMMDGMFPQGVEPLTNQLLDPPAAAQVVGTPGWPTPICWVDGFVGLETIVGARLRTSVAKTHPMRIAYEAVFGDSSPTEGTWDAPAVLLGARRSEGLLCEAGHRGAARIGRHGGLNWIEADPIRQDDCYVHVADQSALTDVIDELLIATG